MKILVTGGAGYIGSHAVYKLIEKGHDVIVIDSLWRGFKENIHPEATFYKADLRDEEVIDNILKKEKSIEGVMHFAGSIVVSESMEKPIEYFENNVGSTTMLLKVLEKNNIKNIIFSSTAAVYGDSKGESIKEDYIKTPSNPYGFSKLAADMLIQSFGMKKANNYLIFRYFNVAGAHENGKLGIRGNHLTHLLPSVLETVIGKREKFTVFGDDYNTRDGSCIRDFIHVNDLVEAHILGIEWLIKNKKSEIINLGSGHGYSVLEVIDETEKTLEMKLNYEIGKRRSGDSPFVLANIDKATALLNWQPKYSLKQIIESDLNFRKKNNGR